MTDTKTFSIQPGATPLEVSFVSWAEQAGGSCIVQMGETTVLATATMSDEEKDLGFFPLTVEYQERYYAAGKIMGSRFMRREGRPTDKSVTTSRLIDRTIRPLFPKDFKREVQVVVTVLSMDEEYSPDIPALLAASTALTVSDIPWAGPVGAVRVTGSGGALTCNSTNEQRKAADFDIIFSGPVAESGEALINMFEGGLKQTPEKDILMAVDEALLRIKELCDFQNDIQKKIGKEKVVPEAPEANTELEKAVQGFLKDKIETAALGNQKEAMKEQLAQLKDELLAFVGETYPDDEEKLHEARRLLDAETKRVVREAILQKSTRPDGRKADELRQLNCTVGLLPRAHGTALFERGETKSLAVLTLGGPGDAQLLDGMEIDGEKHFMLHYNFPPYSVGEARPMRGPGRREIGHGMLAEKALRPVLPDRDSFPYTIRIVAEIMSSNGSTSMAATTSSCLALLDAGVPITDSVTGISIGLVQEGDQFAVLTDIAGVEDHYGDMDFKVAGTKTGVTALQLDVKNRGINRAIFEQALEHGKSARGQLLTAMEKALAAPRQELSQHAPRIETIHIDPDKIRDVIGPGGKVINEIIDATGADIDIEQTGAVFITSKDQESGAKAVQMVQDIVRVPEVGETFTGPVKRLYDFGAMVEILPNTTGMIHISQLALHHVDKVSDVVNVGDVVTVKVIAIDERGRVNLSLKDAQA